MDQFDQTYEDEMFGESESNIQNSSDFYEDNEYDNQNENDNNQFEENDYNENSDYIEQYLRNRGIDKYNVQIENENGEIETVQFDDLSDEEKLSILENSENSPITDEELETLNYLRANGINMKEYTELIQQNAIKDYINQSQTQNFESDNLSDDQIFMLDLIDRFGDSMSNEEIESELENAKQDEELFQKKVEVIRSNYKQKEDEIRIANEQEEDIKRKQDYEEFANSITQSINNLNEIQGVELESEDKQQIADFLLTTDAANRTGFSKLLSDPESLVKLAWFYLYGDQTFEATVDYFKNELSKARRINQNPRTINKTHKRNSNSNESDIYGLNNIFK